MENRRQKIHFYMLRTNWPAKETFPMVENLSFLINDLFSIYLLLDPEHVQHPNTLHSDLAITTEMLTYSNKHISF